MKDQDYLTRAAKAKAIAISVEQAVRYRCSLLGIDPETLDGSPLLVIAARQAELGFRPKPRKFWR